MGDFADDEIERGMQLDSIADDEADFEESMAELQRHGLTASQAIEAICYHEDCGDR